MKLPNGPKTPPWLQLIQWMANPVGYMEAAAQDYGDIFTVPFGYSGGFSNQVFVSNPRAIQQILSNDTKQFSAPGKLNEIVRPLLGNESLMLLDGERHKRQRKLLMPSFHGERMRAYGELICNITEKITSQWTIGKPFLARNYMPKISMGVILQAVFGLYEGSRYQKLEQLLYKRLNATASLWSTPLLFFKSLQKDLGPWSPWGRILRQQQQIDKIIYEEIRERRSKPDPERTDILSLLISARDEQGEGMSDVELRDELLTLLVAGHETTATALAWALYWIHHQPEVREKLLKEIDSLGESPEPMTIFQLPYLTAVCQETLRIYPVGITTFPRVVKSPVKLMGYELEPGTVLIGCIYLTHQRKDLYPEPKQFKPERFLESQFSPYEFIPFGGGSRRCIGEALAIFEMKLVLATILSRYQLALADKRPERPERRGITLTPAGGVKMVMTGQRMPKEQPSEPVASSV